ncbi:helix-turn-helix domain-containing protein [Clostridium lundense]|uniref:helix-turn-helix domain-containing protein n=1 Tax=Clostridium lundense TaxID=319475 RepID=UPI0004826DD3|nr:helix-turn-helix transcriptional regulator [Clostridium lundense]
MRDINVSIGNNVKKLRKGRGLTIDELAANAKVSKSMISEIERGIRNPSITTLWNIANSLKIPLNYLLYEDKMQSAYIYKITEENAIGDNGFNCYPLLNFDEDKRIEIYFNEYMPKSKTEKAAHYNGVEEYALITAGMLTLNLNEEQFTASEGEVIRFLADKPHFYFNETDTITKAFVLMFYPK